MRDAQSPLRPAKNQRKVGPFIEYSSSSFESEPVLNSRLVPERDKVLILSNGGYQPPSLRQESRPNGDGMEQRQKGLDRGNSLPEVAKDRKCHTRMPERRSNTARSESAVPRDTVASPGKNKIAEDTSAKSRSHSDDKIRL